MLKQFYIAILTILLASIAAFPQIGSNPNNGSPVQIFPVSDLREGMRGTSRSVFRGAKSEEFGVEIIGVIPNWIGPGQDMIVGKLSGANAERTSVFAGMSGSPVYIDGKIVGAISYSFPFAKEPLCGITPFAQMLSLVENGPAASAGSVASRSFSFADLSSDTWRPALVEVPKGTAASGFSADSRLMAIAGQTFTPISTPVTFFGISQRTIDMLGPELRAAGMLPVAASGGSSTLAPMKTADATTLLGGDSVVVHLARGDIQISAAGTVTLRDGDKIYGFGHPFFSLGSTNLPMSESHVVTVVPNTNNSFKLAVPDAMVGSMTQDRATGIFGKLGVAPRMLPVKIKLTTSRGRTEEINFESAFDELLTPLIVNAGIANTLVANERGIGESTIELTGEISVKDEAPIRLNRRFAGPQAWSFAAGSAAIPIAALLRGNFEGMEISGIKLDLKVVDGSATGVVERVAIDRSRIRAGETLQLTATVRTESGTHVNQTIPVTIPSDAAPGTISITVGDGNAVQQNTAITHFVPRTVGDLIATLNRLKRPERLYVILARTSSGAVVGSSEMPNLPPSMIATMNNDRSAGGSKATVNTIIAETELQFGNFIVAGSQSVTVEIVR